MSDPVTVDNLYKEARDIVIQNVLEDHIVHGPNYIRSNKMLATLSLQREEEQRAIFHLTESHGATLRNTFIIHECNHQRKKQHDVGFNEALPLKLQSDYIKYNSKDFDKGAQSLLARLKEMPEEWTIVQLTVHYDEDEPWFGESKDVVPDMFRLHVTRLPCGRLAEDRGPCTVLVMPPEGGHSDQMSSILDLLHESVKQFAKRLFNAEQKKKSRQEANANMKSAVGDISSLWLKEWNCLMIGTLRDEELKNLVTSNIDNLLSKIDKNYRERVFNKRNLSLLYQIADGCAHLSDRDIYYAIAACMRDDFNEGAMKLLADGIRELKDKHSFKLMKARRNPVILIVDDRLEFVPWQMIPVLYRHPVSRMPSLHFVNALYGKHKSEIVHGNRIIKKTDAAFYIVNPDNDLNGTSHMLLQFFKKRLPGWTGVEGERPTQNWLMQNLVTYNIFTYAGHGNGSQYVNSEKISKLDINTVPLLFGCSSVSKKYAGKGGRYELYGVSDHYLLAGCPCMVGMLYPVTTNDTDLITMAVLNSGMAGNAVNINDIIGTEEVDADETLKKEPELLSVLKLSRSVAKHYFNSAALIARGLPVKFED